MRKYTRRRRCGNVGIRRFGPDFQARWKEWETRLGFLSFPRFPRRVISTAIFSPFPAARGGGREHGARLRRFSLRARTLAENLFSQEVKQ